MNAPWNKKGFTLIEVMLMIFLISMLAMFAAPFYGRFVFSQEVTIVSDELRSTLMQAKLSSMTGKHDASFGVRTLPGRIVFFQGDSFDAREARFDEVFRVSRQITIFGIDEVVFGRGTGTPDRQPTFTVSDGYVTDTWSLNREGVLQ